MDRPIISTRNLKKIYTMGEVKVKALNGVTLDIKEGEFVMITGPSGSGKTTLLQLLGLLDDPTEGSIILDGEEVAALDEERKSEHRLTKLGYVFQDYALLPELTAVENVLLPLLQQGVPAAEARRRGRAILELVGLGKRMEHRPSELSGGQMQRVSIARALVSGPKILFADEPTANLDSKASTEIMTLIASLNTTRQQTVIMVSHELENQRFANRLIILKDGAIVGDLHRKTQRGNGANQPSSP